MRDHSILIVDDDPRLRKVLTDALECYGFRVVTASNGVEGLEAMEEESPSLVLLDMQMPLLDGRGFARKMAQSRRRVPTVVMSSDPRAEAFAVEIGALACLIKPFGLARLFSCVEFALHQVP